MNEQEMTLNIFYNLPTEVWNKIPSIYEDLEGWLGFGEGGEKGEKGIPYCFSYAKNEKYVCASVEAGGLQFSGLMRDGEWTIWVKNIKKLASQTLGFKVGEIELGEVGYNIEYLT